MTAFFAFATAHPWVVTLWVFFVAVGIAHVGPLVVVKRVGKDEP